MATPYKFYARLSRLLRQAAREASPWPAEADEKRLWKDLQAARRVTPPGTAPGLSEMDAREQYYQRLFDSAGDGLIVIDRETGQVVDGNPAACTMYGYARPELVGLAAAGLVHPEHVQAFGQYLQAVEAHGARRVSQVHLDCDHSPFNVELSGSQVEGTGGALLLVTVRDVSQRVQAEKRLHERVEERNREGAALLAISQTLASALELQPGLILDQMRLIIAYTHAGLFKLDGSTLTGLAVRGPETLERAMPFQIHLQNPEMLAGLFREHASTRIADVQSETVPAEFLRAFLAEQAAPLLEGVKSWMWVPLAIRGRMIGAIGLAHVEEDYFSAHHANLALTVANQAAITMVNAELYENAQTLAALQERQRLARNLHDAVNQSLFSAGLIAEVLPRLWERDPEEGRQSLEDLRRLTRGAQADMRLLLAELRPSTLIDADLGDLLRLLGNALVGRTNIPIEVSVTGAGKLPAEVQVALYRLCQEGLNNIAKHAGASRVEVQLHHAAGGVELRIRDDGRGFDPDQAPPGHYGLSMMRERAAAIGASLSILSQPGGGTEIVITWAGTHEPGEGE